MTQFGKGEFCDFLQIWAPDGVLRKRALMQKHKVMDFNQDLFANYRKIFPGAKSDDFVSIATSIDGDEVIFVRGKPSPLYVFPRQDNEIREIGLDLLQALSWFATSGVLVPAASPFFAAC